MLTDAILIIVSFATALALRLESLQVFASPLTWWPVACSIPPTLIAFRYFGVYHSLVRFVTAKVLFSFGKGALISGTCLFIFNEFFSAGIPRSVPIIYVLLLILSVGGLRFVVRQTFRRPSQSYRVPVVIYGAGDAGRELQNALFHGRDYLPIAFVDDDPTLEGMSIAGCEVYSPASFHKLSRDYGISTALLALPNISRRKRREIIAFFEGLNLDIKTVPAMSDLISGRASIAELRDVSPEEFLGRDPIPPMQALMGKNIAGKVVMVTGAGGSIGAELCRQILSQDPATLILYEVSEYALYQIETDLTEAARASKRETRIIPMLGSVQHEQRLETAITTFQVQSIYHAAAYKHVPLVEENTVEGIRNNVFGSLTIASLASKLNIESFTLISTDKAVRPTNVMGATKRIAELICQAFAQQSPKTVFSIVRFGNVLGSSGSVIPRFRKQIASGGPLTVTHPEVTRYFMTIPEASQLVVQASAMAKSGEVFVLDMGDPVRIADLAVSMVRLHGLTPYFVDHPGQALTSAGDIPICFTGLRNGEKLYEELLIGNDPEPTEHPRIMKASEKSLPMTQLRSTLGELLSACQAYDLPRIHKILQDLPIDFESNEIQSSDLLWTAMQSKEQLNARSA